MATYKATKVLLYAHCLAFLSQPELVQTIAIVEGAGWEKCITKISNWQNFPCVMNMSTPSLHDLRLHSLIVNKRSGLKAYLACSTYMKMVPDAVLPSPDNVRAPLAFQSNL